MDALFIGIIGGILWAVCFLGLQTGETDGWND